MAQWVKNPPAMHKTCLSIGDLGLIPVGKIPREGNGNPLQHSCLGNPMDRGAWWTTVHGIARVIHDLGTKPPPQTHHTLPQTRAKSSGPGYRTCSSSKCTWHAEEFDSFRRGEAVCTATKPETFTVFSIMK